MISKTFVVLVLYATVRSTDQETFGNLPNDVEESCTNYYPVYMYTTACLVGWLCLFISCGFLSYAIREEKKRCSNAENGIIVLRTSANFPESEMQAVMDPFLYPNTVATPVTPPPLEQYNAVPKRAAPEPPFRYPPAAGSNPAERQESQMITESQSPPIVPDNRRWISPPKSYKNYGYQRY